MVSSESSVSPAAPHLCGGNLAAWSGAALRPALGLGPGCDDATVLIGANVPAFRTICKQSVSYRVLGRSTREERSV